MHSICVSYNIACALWLVDMIYHGYCLNSKVHWYRSKDFTQLWWDSVQCTLWTSGCYIPQMGVPCCLAFLRSKTWHTIVFSFLDRVCPVDTRVYLRVMLCDENTWPGDTFAKQLSNAYDAFQRFTKARKIHCSQKRFNPGLVAGMQIMCYSVLIW